VRKVLLSLAACGALALGSAANAAINITGFSGLDAAPAVTNGSTQDYVSWSANTEPSGSFTSWFTFHNSSSGLYSIVAETSTLGATITSLVLSSSDGLTPYYSFTGGTAYNASLLTGNLGTGDFRLTFTGNSGLDMSGNSNPASVVTGNFTFYVQAVPEPATWSLMLLGIGGIGLALRRRRRPVLAQIA
jgi:PEP-CTERM motif